MIQPRELTCCLLILTPHLVAHDCRRDGDEIEWKALMSHPCSHVFWPFPTQVLCRLRYIYTLWHRQAANAKLL